MAILTAAIFLATLQSFYFSSTGIAPFPYAGLAILWLLAIMRLGSPESKVPITAVLVFTSLAIIALASAVAVGEYKSVGGILLSSTAILAVPLAATQTSNAVQAIRAVLFLHFAFLVLQIADYYMTGTYLDYVALSGEVSVWHSRKGFEVGGYLIPRFTGLFNEPGTYSGVIGSLLATLFLLQRRISVTIAFGLATLVGSASMTGMIMAAVISGAAFYEYLRRKPHPAFVFALAAISIVAAIWIMQRFMVRLAYTGPDDVVFDIVDWLISAESVTALGHAVSDLPDFISVDYLGSWMMIYLHLGALGLSSLVASLAPAIVLNPLGALALLLAKIKVTYPLMFVLVGILWTKHRNDSRSKRATSQTAA